MSNLTPGDELAGRVAELFDYEFGNAIGRYGRLDVAWDDAMPEDDPDATWTVVDTAGRRFEVEFEVTVTELTPEVLAARAVQMELLKKLAAGVTTA